MKALCVRLLFHPTLLWNRLLARLVPGRNWFDSIDETVILGALPLAKVRGRFRALGVMATVNLVREWHGPLEEYAASGIVQLYLPTIDFVAPTLAQLRQGVDFIRSYANRGEKVYVHCKAGRGRSATVVVCWLIQSQGLTPEAAQRRIESVRPHVNRGVWKRDVVRQFVEQHPG